MKVCEQLTKRFRGCKITALGLLYEVIEFQADGMVLLYDNLLDQYVRKSTKDIATFEIVESVNLLEEQEKEYNRIKKALS